MTMSYVLAEFGVTPQKTGTPATPQKTGTASASPGEADWLVPRSQTIQQRISEADANLTSALLVVGGVNPRLCDHGWSDFTKQCMPAPILLRGRPPLLVWAWGGSALLALLLGILLGRIGR